ncbi:shikimate kinase 1 [Gammaproteobacteria bacterium]
MVRNVFLIGLMGAGKSSVGRQLACAMQLPFVDSDKVIEARTGVSIPLIFEMEGEIGFRAREKNVIADLTASEGLILATGGGVVLDPENREYLKHRGCVVYLRASVDVLVARTAHDRNRPLLQNTDPYAKLRELLEARDPLYREIAHFTLDVSEQSIRAVVRELVQQFATSSFHFLLEE